MTAKALFVKLEAKPGKENEVAKFLRDGQGLVQQEPATPNAISNAVGYAKHRSRSHHAVIRVYVGRRFREQVHCTRSYKHYHAEGNQRLQHH